MAKIERKHEVVDGPLTEELLRSRQRRTGAPWQSCGNELSKEKRKTASPRPYRTVYGWRPIA